MRQARGHSIILITAAVTLCCDGAGRTAVAATSASTEELAKTFSVTAFSETGYPIELTIREHTVVRIEDRDRDGDADRWSLMERGRVTCVQWSRSGKGGPDAAELFGSDGQSKGILAWGHYREEEAEKIRREMEGDRSPK